MYCSTVSGSVAKNLAPLQNQKKPSQLGKLIIFIRKKLTHKGEKYSVKLQKYYFCNGTAPFTLFSTFIITLVTCDFNTRFFEKEVWKAIFVISCIICLIWLINTLKYVFKPVTVDDFITEVKRDQIKNK